MRLCKLIVENLRCYRHRSEITIGDLTALIGKNDVGKSTILEALELFFNGELVKIDQQDPHVHNRDKPVRISCVFSNFPSEIVLDTKARTSLAAEHLLNEDGLLEVVKTYDCRGKTIKPTVAVWAYHPTCSAAADLLQLKHADLLKRARDLNVDLDKADQRSNVDVRTAIRDHLDDSLGLKATSVPLASEDGAKVWDQLQRALPTFALFQSDRPSKDDDPEVQDPMRLAIAEAVESVQSELDAIREKVRECAVGVARRTLEKLRDLDPTLAQQLNPVFKAQPRWDGFKLALNGDEDIPINKRGSGVRRLILLSFFRAQAEQRQLKNDNPSIIYAIEEPESSQHPANQQLLVRALIDLSEGNQTQVLLTTHVPGIAAMLPTESIRFVHRNADGHPIVETGSDETMRRVADDLGVLPDSRVRVLLYVEGPNDIAFLGHMARLLRSSDPNVIDIDADPRVAFVPTGGSTLGHWVTGHYLAELKLKEVHIFDRDEATPPKYQKDVDRINQRGDGSWAGLTSKREMENYLHPEAIAAVLGVHISFSDTSDVPALVAEAVHAASGSAVTPWADLDDDKKSEKIGRAKKRLNRDVAQAMTLKQLAEIDKSGEIRGWLTHVASALEIQNTVSGTVPKS